MLCLHEDKQWVITHLWVFLGILHDAPPHAVHGLVALALYWQLTVDVI